ncbi:hypothetical protein D0A40_21035 [Xanthomonas campestris pv. raphani]|nr:hypothetical protein D0A40_21035 [Xanthomonas campestris pv. raphani]
MLMITAVRACCCERENEDGGKLALVCEGIARFIGECPCKRCMVDEVLRREITATQRGDVLQHSGDARLRQRAMEACMSL